MAKLEGITAISGYMARSDATILDMIRSAGFPATKTKAAVWTADTKEIDLWRAGQDKPVQKPQPVVMKSKKGTVKTAKK